MTRAGALGRRRGAATQGQAMLLRRVFAAAACASHAQNLFAAAEGCSVSVAGLSYNLCPLAVDVSLCKPGATNDVMTCYNVGILRNVLSPCQGIPSPAVENLKTSLGLGCRVLGKLENPIIGPLGFGQGVMVTYTDGDPCGESGMKWSSSIKVVCDPNAVEPRLESAATDSKCNYAFTVVSRYGCPMPAAAASLPQMGMGLRGPPAGQPRYSLEGEIEEHVHGLSCPSNLLSMLLMIAAVYLGAGSYYKMQVMGITEFPDFIPHIGFWLGYPSLVMDGIDWASLMLTNGAIRLTGGEARTTTQWRERAQPHADRRNAHRDTFAFFVPPPEPKFKATAGASSAS
eukprot:gnl/TRDRNA2_/TRDRNA2_180864_c0_seq1.p1 gnl/TRDRNA2_/TRDRNA2_180864_c0~~gnl/TRDRNA2_/TRDRNA2_180864_c0_seq1.p1  ORF type:complete len:343 (+),score=40.98 gnl/TRDRNA2_/TRDRNA2_180864_c0_seq1:83-1111(+)